MLRVVLIIAVVALTIYCAVDVAQSRRLRVRLLPHWMWAVLVIAVPVVGPLAWLATGRPQENPQVRPHRAPDDDEDFLRGLG